MNNPHLEELAALHALGLLDEAARTELLKAMESDPEVASLVRDYAGTAAWLALDAPPVKPPPELKRELMRRLPARKTESNLISFPSWVPYAMAACLMVLGVYQVWQTHNLNRELAAAQETIRNWQWQVSEEAERQALADTRVMPLEAKDPAYGSARLIVTWNSRLYQGVVTVQNLPAVPAGHDYQLWVLDPHEPVPVSAGLLTTATGSQNFTVHPVGTENPGFAVSLEPAGGSPAPTGPILFAVAPIE
jgi:anti-sigma-K factor RskA